LSTYRVLLAGCVRVRKVVEVTASSADEASSVARAAAEVEGFEWDLDELLEGAEVEPGSVEVEHVVSPHAERR
jgi:hypothetical protein